MKKNYTRPTLARHGSVEQVTLAMLGLMNPDGSGRPLRMMRMAGS